MKKKILILISLALHPIILGNYMCENILDFNLAKPLTHGEQLLNLFIPFLSISWVCVKEIEIRKPNQPL